MLGLSKEISVVYESIKELEEYFLTVEDILITNFSLRRKYVTLS